MEDLQALDRNRRRSALILLNACVNQFFIASPAIFMQSFNHVVHIVNHFPLLAIYSPPCAVRGGKIDGSAFSLTSWQGVS
jgi:hypothetical protein